MEEREIKVSVIVPVYNVEAYLEECLDSILGQTLREIELICVDDGSSDTSPDILKKYSAADERVVVITQKNAGAGAARNTGVAHARGRYIGFVDSDDILYPTMYEELYAKAVKTDAEMVITGEIDTFFGDNIVFPLPHSAVTAEELSLGFFKAIEYPEILQNVFLWNRIYSREFWNRHQLKIPEGRRFAEDLLICTQTSVLPKRVAYVEGPLYRYRNFRENSLSDTLAKSQKKLDYIVAVDETKEFLKQTGMYEFFAADFLTFTCQLFAMLQATISDYDCFMQFFSGYAQLLDPEDVAILRGTWLNAVCPEVIAALQDGKKTSMRAVYRKGKAKRRVRK